ncbi:uncharacterized protein EI90DRAFT_3039066 [Cantharellus anzutake]|uniref:uncharacterized protein n=1 Tax=Cantharellus anzutake TaxID=1750568 RepID=UPI001904CC87|nr:uncharacterized protein EI90DRAFT_3039066 [Cantharellus anzutake]KAF8338770.1 hypothetical protein EI90DRAFT_3039066 [Cantharellus anzutake]
MHLPSLEKTSSPDTTHRQKKHPQTHDLCSNASDFSPSDSKKCHSRSAVDPNPPLKIVRCHEFETVAPTFYVFGARRQLPT